MPVVETAARLGLGEAAERWADRVRRVIDPAHRRRHRQILEDHRGCAETLTRIAHGAPAGDPGRVALFVASFGTPFGWKLEGALSLSARLAGFQPAMLELGDDPWARRYHALFARPRSVAWRDHQARQVLGPAEPAFRDFLAGAPTVSGLLRLRFRGVDVGRIALSNWLNAHKFTRLDLADAGIRDELLNLLARTQRDVLAAEATLDAVRPATVLLLEKGLTPAAEVVGAALHRGIPVVQYVGSQQTGAYVLKRYSYENRHQHPFSLSAESWARALALPWDAAREDELMRELAESYRAGTWFNRKFLHQGKRIKEADDVRRQLGLDPSKKTAVVFSHVLWDATFFYGDGLFEDYETWLLETVRAAAANPRLNWVVKLHPDLVWKLKYEGRTADLRDVIAMRSATGGALPPHVTLVMPETDISTYSFFAITDYCLTVRGTIGIEMACHGVPVLTAGTGRYSGLGFTRDSASVEEYRARLARLETEPAMAPGEIERARRFAHTLFRRRLWPMRTFDMVKRPMDQTGHALDTDLVPRVSTFDALARAEDTRALVQWLASTETDYLRAQPL